MEFWIFLENFFKILKQKHFFRKIPINPDFRNHPLFFFSFRIFTAEIFLLNKNPSWINFLRSKP